MFALGTQIRLRRKELGMTIDGLAVGAKVSRARLIALEKDDDNVTIDLLVRIANALGMTELYVDGLRLAAATPDVKAAMAMAATIQNAQELLDKAVEARDQFRQAIGPVSDLIASVIAQDKGDPPFTEEDKAAVSE